MQVRPLLALALQAIRRSKANPPDARVQYGDLQAIAGKTFQEIEGMDVKVLKESRD